MATRRLDVDVPRVNWFDGLSVTEDDMDDEQSRNIGIDAATVNNFFGSGVLNHSLADTTFLDTDSLNSQQQALLDAYSFDGQNVYIGSSLTSVSDEVQGVQIAVTLTGVDLDGTESTKVSIIGDEFGDNLIHDDLIFHENGTQITRGRYNNLRSIIFNDFSGNLRGSRAPARESSDVYEELVGRCVVREARSLEVSPDPIIASQMDQPTRFFNSFSPAQVGDTVSSMLQDAIGADKSVADLGIGFLATASRSLAPNDVSTMVGQKFLANGSNIQKVSILLSVKEDTTVLPADAYNWSGSITMTIYELQTDVSCPTDPVPDNAVDFDPNPTIITQLSLDSDDLEKQGVVLTDGYDAYQIVDFVFTGSPVSDPLRTAIETDRYYAIAVHRSGDTSVGTLVLAEVPHQVTHGYMIVYDGIQWVNVTDSDMWFAIYGDYVKMADGIGYDEGVGVEVPKIKEDDTNTEVPYVEGFHSYYTVTRDAYNYVIMETQNEFSDPVQDQRTGNNVYSRITPMPSFSLNSSSQLSSLLVSEPSPVMLACARDQNARGNPASITGTMDLIGLVTSNELNMLNPDADLLNNNLVGSTIKPDSAGCTTEYRIISATEVDDAYGDTNGDGEIGTNDYTLIDDWLSKYNVYLITLPVGYQKISASDAYFQGEIADGELDVLQLLRADVNDDGYVGADDSALIQSFVNREISTFPAGSTFPRLNIKVESILDPLTTSVNIPATCPGYSTAPYSVLTWEIDYFATWIPDLLVVQDTRREMPTTFTDDVAACDGGKNNFFVPGDLVIGELQLNPDGTHYSVDFEMNHLSLDIPITDSYGNATFVDGYTGILLFDNFVAETSNGKTFSGFDAMKYADGTYVQLTDFADGKVKIAPCIQSTANGFDAPFGSIIEDIVGMYYDPATSLMTLYLDNLFDDGYESRPALSTKILVSVYLKRAGFKNDTRTVTMGQMRTLLDI